MSIIKLRCAPYYLLTVFVPESVNAAAELLHSLGVSAVKIKRELKSLILIREVAGSHADKAGGHAQGIVRQKKLRRSRKKGIGYARGIGEFLLILRGLEGVILYLNLNRSGKHFLAAKL